MAHIFLRCRTYKDLRTTLDKPQLATQATEFVEQTQILGQAESETCGRQPSAGGRLKVLRSRNAGRVPTSLDAQHAGKRKASGCSLPLFAWERWAARNNVFATDRLSAARLELGRAIERRTTRPNYLQGQLIREMSASRHRSPQRNERFLYYPQLHPSAPPNRRACPSSYPSTPAQLKAADPKRRRAGCLNYTLPLRLVREDCTLFTPRTRKIRSRLPPPKLKRREEPKVR
ncbi:hypothetical protein PMIN01_13359 [Paraphaeosphaeria minitans]|uniref:Uncharacterized protein n=1 Tax=Paraphaeosphaeria minitans TaxID=565426 RepID=A0A9P6KJG7_9PLEO|nr:hypothetical protein PMIN01_13359 [Paraphaeosphaeria minitans]